MWERVKCCVSVMLYKRVSFVMNSQCCTVHEKEYNFILICPMYCQLRINLLSKYFHTWSSLYKLKKLMKSDRICILRKLSKYMYIYGPKVSLLNSSYLQVMKIFKCMVKLKL